jgi:uncharacterized glyoxalase superfamily protein PhnB
MKENNKSQKKGTSVKHIPAGFGTVTPFLIVTQATMLIEFLIKAFNGELTYIMKGEDGKVMHATVKIGDSMLMISDATEKMGPTPCMLYLYVDDVDKVYADAMAAKGMSIREPKDEFYGDRSAGVKDPWDNQWWIATHIEDVSDEEMQKRMDAFQAQEV